MRLPRMCVRRCTAVGVNAFGGGISGNGQSKVCAVHVQTHTGREPGAGAKDAAVLRRGCVGATPHRAGSSAAAILSATGR